MCLKKTEYLVVNSQAVFEVLINDTTTVKHVDEFKYLGALVNGIDLGIMK